MNTGGRLTHVINGAEQMCCFCQCDKLNGRDFHRVLEPLGDTVQRRRTPHGEAPRVTHTQEPAIRWAHQTRGAAWNLEKAKVMKVTQATGLQTSKKVTFTSSEVLLCVNTAFHYQDLIYRGWPCLRSVQMRPAGNYLHVQHAFSPLASSVLDSSNVPIKWIMLKYSCGWSAKGGFAPTRWNHFSVYKITRQHDFLAQLEILKESMTFLQLKKSL